MLVTYKEGFSKHIDQNIWATQFKDNEFVGTQIPQILKWSHICFLTQKK